MGCAGMMRVSVWDGETLHQRCPKSQLADAATVPHVFRICQVRTKWRLQGAKKKEFTRHVPHMSSFSYLCRGKSCEYGERVSPERHQAYAGSKDKVFGNLTASPKTE